MTSRRRYGARRRGRRRGRARCALWFRNFSTWDGVAGIYLEDLFVRPQFRRHGLARALLATLARECVDGGYTRLSWAVLDWNVNAIALYDAVGGQPQSEWITYRVSGPELSALAEILSGAADAHCTADGLNSSASATSATRATGTP